MFCSKCGADNAEGARFCAKCGAALAVAVPEPAAAAPTTMRGITNVSTTTPGSPTGKLPWVALALSLFLAGLGQFYNNDGKKGALMLGGWLLGVLLTAGLLSIPFTIWSMVDGWRVASGKGKPW